MWNLEDKGPRCFNSRDITFYELRMGYSANKDISELSDSHNKNIQVEVENYENFNDDNHEFCDIEQVVGENEQTTSRSDVNSYMLTRDKQRREIRPPQRLSQADMIYFAPTVADYIECQEQVSYKETMSSEQRNDWLKVMNEEMSSLSKNNTWELVSKPK